MKLKGNIKYTNSKVKWHISNIILVQLSRSFLITPDFAKYRALKFHSTADLVGSINQFLVPTAVTIHNDIAT